MPNDLLTGKKMKTTKKQDLENIQSFVVTMMNKMQAGKKEHAGESTLDPIKEAMDECVDMANYAMIMYVRLSALRGKVEKL